MIRTECIGVLCASLVSLMISACGGGGSSDNGGATPPPTPAAPTITTQPASITVVAGANATFSVAASGTGITDQWQSSPDGTAWTDIASATSATYTITAASTAQSGTAFRVVVTNVGGSVTSAAATLTVTAPIVTPTITTQPTAQSVVTGSTATFSVVAAGTNAMYQWQSSADGGATFASIAGATGASYTTAATTSADNGKQFRVAVSNSAGSVTSSAVVLTVTASATPASAPVISVQPVSQAAYTTTNDFGASHAANFASAATGSPTPTYQWQVSTDAGGTFADISGATGASYTTPAVAIADNGKKFRLVATNSVGVAHSSAATLGVAAIGVGINVSGLAISATGDLYASGKDYDPMNASVFAGQFMGVRIRHVAGDIVTLAGGTYSDANDVDATGTTARIYVPMSIALDASGNAYVPDDGNRVRKISPAGVVSTLAGSDTNGGFDNGQGAAATFRFSPYTRGGITLDSSSNVYVVDQGNVAIRMINPAGAVTTFAGGTSGFMDGTGTAAKFTNPHAITSDNLGNLYVIDSIQANNSVCAIRKITTTAVVTTITQGANGNSCSTTTVDGPIATAVFAYPDYLAVDSNGTIYVAEAFGNVRKITSGGTVSTLTGVKAGAMTVDASDNLYVTTDTNSYLPGIQKLLVSVTIQKVTPAGVVTLLP